jgi:hypothetical protein
MWPAGSTACGDGSRKLRAIHLPKAGHVGDAVDERTRLASAEIHVCR